MAGSTQFPKGLRVLLVDDPHSCASIRTQLESPSLQYAVTSVTSASEALGFLRTGVAAFDVVLAESRIVAADEAVGRSFVDAFEDTPVVLMSSCSTPDDVMRAVKLGAVDFLDKPLSLLKLKNIWQHSVRKMMLKAAGPRLERSATAPTPFAAATTPGCVSWAPAPCSVAVSPTSHGPEPPATPSLMSADLPESFSACCSEDVSVRNSMDGHSESFMDAMNSALFSCASAPTPMSRPTIPHPTLPAAPLANGGPAPATWPRLEPGCVWGTPANGPVPPPLPGVAATPAAPSIASWGSAPTLQPSPSTEAPVLIKSCSSGVLPVPSATDEVMIPEGFFSDATVTKSASGPLGLQLKKSASLLNLINSALGSNDNLSGLAAMVC